MGRSETQVYRPRLDHTARLLLFVGVWGLVVGTPTLSDTPAGKWWLASALGLCFAGLLAQHYSTPKPLKPVSTPVGWLGLLAVIVVLPLVLGWFDWEWPWTLLLVVIAAVIGGWAAYLPEHRRQTIQDQYRQQALAEPDPSDR